MEMVGIFAGRGDVVLAMSLAFIVGMWAGWQFHKAKHYLSNKLGKKNQ